MTEQNGDIVFKYWNGIVPEYMHEMYKLSPCRFRARSQMALDIPLKINTWQKFYGQKYFQKSFYKKYINKYIQKNKIEKNVKCIKLLY